MSRMTLSINVVERDALARLAGREYRKTEDQAAYIIRRELERLGLLPIEKWERTGFDKTREWMSVTSASTDTNMTDAVWDWANRISDGKSTSDDAVIAAMLYDACATAVNVLGPCQLDHHGLCQAHHLRTNDAGKPECEVALLRKAVEKAEGGK